MKISRRGLAAALLAPAAPSTQKPAQLSAQEELGAARARTKAAIEALRKVRVDAALEPDFTFKA